MPSKRLSNKSFERDASRLRVLMNNDFGGDGIISFVPVMAVYDGAAGEEFVGDNTGGLPIAYLSDGNNLTAWGAGIIQTSGSVTITPVIRYVDGSTGDVRIRTTLDTFNSGNNHFVTQTGSGWTTVSMPDNDWSKSARYDMTEIEISYSAGNGHLIEVSTQRDGASGLDTWASYIGVWGWKITLG